MSAGIFRWLRLRGRGLFRRRTQESELDRELGQHIELLIEENLAAGMTPEEARLAALKEFGGIDQYREACRDSWRLRAIDGLLSELRFAFKSLCRSPGLAFIAIVTLALGIGANTSMFSLVNSVMLKPPPYPKSDHLVQIYRSTPQGPDGLVSAADALDLFREADGLGEIAAYSYADASLAEPGESAEFCEALRVSAGFLPVLRVQPQLGRSFEPREDVVGNHRVVILSERIWKNRLGAAPDVVGRSIRVNGEPHEIVGVLPGSFNEWRHLGWVDVFVPLALTESESTDRASLLLGLIGRRSGDRSPEQAAAFIAGFGERLAAAHPALNAAASWRAEPLMNVLVGRSGGVILTMLIGLSGFVVLIACSNLANILLARTMARAREFAVRSALGASRLQLLRPLIAESLLLALVGGACAIVVALWFSDWLAMRSVGDNGERVVLEMDWAVFAWAFAASLVTATAFGLAPALFAIRLNLNETLKSGGRGTTGGRRHTQFRHLLIVGQFALAMVLLTGAALFMRGLSDLNNRRTGWESRHLVAGTILLPAAAYADAGRITAFQRLALERLEALPGVESASISDYLPCFTWQQSRRFVVQGSDRPEPGREPAALINAVSPGYFSTVSTALLAGRAFSHADTIDSLRVAIVSERTASAFFGGQDPIGQRIARAGDGPLEWIEIVGVAADVRSILPDPTPVSHQVYLPAEQEPHARMEIAVRSSGVAPSVLVASILNIMTTLDPDLPVRDLKPVDVRIARANYQLTVLREMLSAFAVLGLGLAAMGIYGVIARVMAQRSGEFGIRLALGAQVRDISRLVLGSGVRLALTGAMLGFIGAFGLSRLLAAAFPNMQLDHGSTLAGSAVVLIAVALFACYLPARRAARISPTEALRAD